jgi:hypothetical protein
MRKRTEQRTELLRAMTLGPVDLTQTMTTLAWQLLDAPKEER